MKPKILIIGDSAAVHSGFAKVIRELFIPLYNSGKFDICQVGWFHYGNFEEVPWQIYHTRMANTSSGPKCTKDDAHGEITAPDVCRSFKPDVVWTCGDPWMLPHLPQMRTEFGFQWVVQVYIDGGPLLESHAKVWNRADAIVPVTWFGHRILSNMVSLDKDLLLDPILCGVNLETYRPFSSTTRRSTRDRIVSSSAYLSTLKDPIILGYVGRNQRRKHLPCFYLLNAMLLSDTIRVCTDCGRHVAPRINYEWAYNNSDKFLPRLRCPRCDAETAPKEDMPEFAFWLHTPPGDRGWNLPEMEAAWGLKDKVVHTIGHQLLQGVGEKDFASVYNTFDVYLSFATEGFGLPLLEAAACGVPVVSPRFAASQEMMDHPEVADLLWKPDGMYLEDGTGIPRPLPDYSNILDILCRLADKEEYGRFREASIGLARRYTWEEPVKQWELLLMRLANQGTQQTHIYRY